MADPFLDHQRHLRFNRTQRIKWLRIQIEIYEEMLTFLDDREEWLIATIKDLTP